MSIEQCQRTVNGLDKEIANLEKKKALKDKDIADLQNKINSAQKSIKKHSSPSTINNKMRQIASCESDKAKKSKESAELGKKIADKRKKRSEAYLKLQKEQDWANQRLQASYESRIDELQQQLVKTVVIPEPNDIASEEEYDVFVSHAWEDKEDFVDEFVSELRKQELKVWYDTNKLKWGDPMREKIDKGLSKSRYGVVVLSPNYMAEHKYWTKAELNGLFQVETVNGKTILPIWHNLTKKQVVEYSPIIADRKAMTTASMTPAEIASELKNLLVPENMEDNSNE